MGPEATMFWGFLFFTFNFLLQLLRNFLCQPFLFLVPLYFTFHELTFLPILANNDVLLFCTQKTSFMLFLNKFDIFEKKILKVRTIWIYCTFLLESLSPFQSLTFCIVQVPLSVCEWFKDYQPVSTGKQEIEHAYE